jgi:hypothetical protein
VELTQNGVTEGLALGKLSALVGLDAAVIFKAVLS